jgi:hypothetical protein
MRWSMGLKWRPQRRAAGERADPSNPLASRLRANHDATTTAKLSTMQPLWRRFVFVLHSVCSPVGASFAPRSRPAHSSLVSLASSGDLVPPARLCLRFVSTVDLRRPALRRSTSRLPEPVSNGSTNTVVLQSLSDKPFTWSVEVILFAP